MSFIRSRTASETAEAHATMSDCFDQIQQWHDVVAETHPVSSNSVFELADGLSEPFRSSHTVSFHILTAVDHLHALRALFVDAQAQHIFAPYTLIRSAIENAATAMWIMGTPEPRTIAVRSLKMEYANLRDVAKAQTTVGLKPDSSREEILNEVITKNGMQKEGVKANPPGFLKIIETVSKSLNLGIAPTLVWQMCSAAAHGRNWASIMLAMMEAEDDASARVISGRLTSDEKAIAHALLVVTPLLDKAMTMQGSCCRPEVATGSSFFKPEPKLLIPRTGLYIPK